MQLDAWLDEDFLMSAWRASEHAEQSASQNKIRNMTLHQLIADWAAK